MTCITTNTSGYEGVSLLIHMTFDGISVRGSDNVTFTYVQNPSILGIDHKESIRRYHFCDLNFIWKGGGGRMHYFILVVMFVFICLGCDFTISFVWGFCLSEVIYFFFLLFFLLFHFPSEHIVCNLFANNLISCSTFNILSTYATHLNYIYTF